MRGDAVATFRDHPYGRFVFQVDFGAGDPGSVDGGFEEVGPIAADIEVIEYRAGNDRVNTARKLPGLNRVHDVTLKRGVIGSTTLFEWFRAGTLGQADRRDVTIRLLNEDHTDVVFTWRLVRAWPVRYVVSSLSATCSDVAIEELVLTCEGVDVE
jgi:phage tail-like protein